MARQIIDTTTDHGTYKGDPAKVAFEKVNANDAELYALVSGLAALGGHNLLISCGIPVNQAGFGGGAVAAGSYGYDMWKAGTGGCNVTINAATGVFTHTSGALQQVVETPLLAWGRPLTISVEDPTGNVAVSVGGATGTITAGTGRRGVTVTPSGSGNMVVQLTAAGASYSRPKLERGSAATPFVPVPLALDLAMVQRYYEHVSGLSIPAGAFNAVDIMFGCEFKVAKRAAPAMKVISPGGWVGNNSSGTITTIVLSNPSTNGFQGDVTAFTGSVTTGSTYSLRGCAFAADARL